jgi:periplasmic divalent cation tolerance protein
MMVRINRGSKRRRLAQVAENNKGPDQGVVEGRLPAESAAVLVYTTFPTREAAIAAGRILVEERHAGCINILPAMTSVYVWNGVTEVADEVVLIAKVPPAAVDSCLAAVKRMHPYETPALLVLAVAAVDAGYLTWLKAGTGPATPTPETKKNG